MKKKLFGISIGTIFSTLLCLIVAVLFWFFAKYKELDIGQILAISTRILRL